MRREVEKKQVRERGEKRWEKIAAFYIFCLGRKKKKENFIVGIFLTPSYIIYLKL